ncbi:pre-mRNA-splicing factor Syf2-like [Spodoptera frugiperda]|uniref:Pre-mRNA-splicing factor SYF2 n=1 Tax=Spodoptera frugiperda TaxID=7108 RepID=A0A9R0D7V4_SPOFR|nr:pre-mRNA-splicing factor Syf2-like [Spodoptera frugiperda]
MAPQIEVSTWTPTSISFAERQENRIKRLRSLRSARKQARINNYKETVAEEARSNLPPNSTVDDQANRQGTEKAGEEHSGVQQLNILSAADAERVECKKRKSPDEGFSTYEQATVSQYNGLVENIPSAADTEENETKKQKYDDASDGVSNVHEDREEAIDKMVNDLSEEQIVKRARYSTRCGYNDDADIDSINDKKLDTGDWNLNRFYGENTTSTKQNLILPFCCWCKLQQYAQYLSQI